jgi:hypothetical protein
VKKPNSSQKSIKHQKIHGFFLHLIGFDEEYLFLILQYLHHENDGDGDGDVRGHDCGRVHVRVRGDVRESENVHHDDVHENEYDHRGDGVYDGFLPFWLK